MLSIKKNWLNFSKELLLRPFIQQVDTILTSDVFDYAAIAAAKRRFFPSKVVSKGAILSLARVKPIIFATAVKAVE